MKYIIYGLTDPDTDEIRYIGKSTSGLKRPKEHKKPSNLKTPSHKVNWIKSLINQGKTYKVIIIEETQTPEELDAREIFWISEYKNKGANLTNSSDGGEGALGRVTTEETKEKISQKRKQFEQNNPEVAKKRGELQRKQHVFIDNKECKECFDCKLYKPLTMYSFHSETWDGHNHICKECAKNRTAKYREQNPSKTLSEEEWKESYKARKEAMSNGAKAAYEANPELKNNLSKKKSKAIVGIPVDANKPILEFESALIAYKESGFNNTYISLSIKNGKPYKGYIWKFAANN